MSADAEETEDMKRVKAAAEVLIEHFDAVQIMATRSAPDLDGTLNVSYGTGNWFARYGHAVDWVKKADFRGYRDVMKEET